jgi:hypothetical protein
MDRAGELYDEYGRVAATLAPFWTEKVARDTNKVRIGFLRSIPWTEERERAAIVGSPELLQYAETYLWLADGARERGDAKAVRAYAERAKRAPYANRDRAVDEVTARIEKWLSAHPPE